MRFFLSLWLALALAFIAPAGPVWAQVAPLASDSATQATIDFDAWQATATRAEAALEAGRASNAALETLRLEIVEWRDKFLAAQNTNKARIATIQSQITALGPVPESGSEEEEIANRRAELNAQLARLQAPVLATEEAHSRAAGLIAEIDRIIRDRQAEELVSLGPSPLNPANWAVGLEDLLGGFDTLWSEFRRNWQNEVRQAEFRQNAPVAIGVALFGLILILRGRRWFDRLALRVRQLSPRGVEVWHFLISLGKVLIPWVGILFLAQSIIQTGFVGLRGSTILNYLPLWGFSVLVVRWLADRLFPEGDGPALMLVEPSRRAEARHYATGLALLAMVASVVDVLSEVGNFTPAAEAVIGFPVVCLLSLLLFRMGQFISRQIALAEEGEAEVGYRHKITRLVFRAAQIVAVIGPLMWAVGYRNAADALVYPTVMTLILLGLVEVLQKLVSDIYRLVTRAEDEAQEALIPVLIGFLLTLATLPLLALVWGVRAAELSEIWTRFRVGFTIGDTTISPTDFIMFAVVFSLGYMLTRVIQGALRSSILPKTKIDAGGQTAIVSGLGYVGVVLSAIVAITSAGLDLSSIAIVAGALSVGIGFGLQNIVSNFVSGIILLIERPVAEGDWIEVGGKMGYVRDISVRSTRIETFDRTDLIVPNADLVSGTVTNYTRGNTIGRVIVPVGVAYGTDTRRVETILREIAEAHPMVLLNPPPSVIFQGFGADSLDFEIRCILRDVNWSLAVKSDLNHEIARRFTEEAIEIPFAQRDIWLRNPEALTGAPKPAPAPAAPAAMTPPREVDFDRYDTPPKYPELDLDDMDAAADGHDGDAEGESR
jgi:potassium-dependent mechanosensitive channel